MVEPGSDLDLAQEAIGTEACGELGVKHLDGDLAVVPGVVREVHGGHATATDLAIHLIAVLQFGAQALQRRGSGFDHERCNVLPIRMVMLSLPPPSSASWSSASHACRAEVIVSSRC